MSNFHHKVQEVKIIHCVFYFRVLNFRRPRERRKNFNGEYFPIYGIIHYYFLNIMFSGFSLYQNEKQTVNIVCSVSYSKLVTKQWLIQFLQPKLFNHSMPLFLFNPNFPLNFFICSFLFVYFFFLMFFFCLCFF